MGELKKVTIERICGLAEDRKYKCLSQKYKGRDKKLKFQCDKGHVYETTWNSFRQGNGCPVCSGHAKPTIEFVKEFAQSFDYIILSDKYINAHSKLNVKCDKGHEYKVTWANFSKGRKCPKCRGKYRTLEEVKEFISQEADGYECLNGTYKNCSTKLKIRCNKGHEYEVAWNSFQQGRRCAVCANNQSLTIEYIKKIVPTLVKGYKCLSFEYKNAQEKLLFQCDKGHVYECNWNHFNVGTRCPECAISNSRIHTEESLDNIYSYRICVWRFTEHNYLKYKEIINPTNKKRSYKRYHIDHIYSVAHGFHNNILPRIIASPTNLQMLSAFDNQSKNGRSDMTKEELFKGYEEFILLNEFSTEKGEING